MNIDINRKVSEDDLGAFTYMSDPALAKYIKLFKADLFGSVHVPLSCGKSLRRHIKGCIARHGLLGNKNAAGMDAPHIRKVSNFHAC